MPLREELENMWNYPLICFTARQGWWTDHNDQVAVCSRSCRPSHQEIQISCQILPSSKLRPLWFPRGGCFDYVCKKIYKLILDSSYKITCSLKFSCVILAFFALWELRKKTTTNNEHSTKSIYLKCLIFFLYKVMNIQLIVWQI